MKKLKPKCVGKCEDCFFLFIEECIHAIYNCELPETASIQVFVVDGMSDDGTRIKVENLKSEYSSLQLIDNVQQLTPFAFNLGIYAGGKVDFVQIVGARHILSTNYLMNALLQQQDGAYALLNH